MVEYVLSDKNGRYIRKDNGTNRYVTIRGERYAMRFPEYNKAVNVLENCVAKNIRSAFSVVEVVTGNDTQTPTPTREEVIKSIVEKNIVNDDIRGRLEKVEAITSLTESMDARAEELSTLQSNVEKEIVDIQHYIEFGNLNACLCFKRELTGTIIRQDLSVVVVVSESKRTKIKDQNGISTTKFRFSKAREGIMLTLSCM